MAIVPCDALISAVWSCSWQRSSVLRGAVSLAKNSRYNVSRGDASYTDAARASKLSHCIICAWRVHHDKRHTLSQFVLREICTRDSCWLTSPKHPHCKWRYIPTGTSLEVNFFARRSLILTTYSVNVCGKTAAASVLFLFAPEVPPDI